MYKIKVERENIVQVFSRSASWFLICFVVVDPGLDETDRVRPVDPCGGIHLGRLPPLRYRRHRRAAVTDAVAVVAAIRHSFLFAHA